MRVYISVDMEGIAGISHPAPTGSKDAKYPAAVELMVAETNAAIEGAMAGGATAVLVNDSHGGMFNLTPADIHRDATVLQGQKAWSMVAGAQPGPDGARSFDVVRLAIVHRTGIVPVGESSVVICVAAPHRGAAFDACRYAIEELKARAPIWKSEHSRDGSIWLGAPARHGPAGKESG